jgi:hypothetical protein
MEQVIRKPFVQPPFVRSLKKEGVVSFIDRYQLGTQSERDNTFASNEEDRGKLSAMNMGR